MTQLTRIISTFQLRRECPTIFHALPIHLNNTNLQKSTQFWTKIVGMELRKTSANSAEFGTENKTLVVVHQTAKTKWRA